MSANLPPPAAAGTPGSTRLHALAALAAAGVLRCAASAHRRPAPSTLVIDGAGDGHGVGMSQEGALGYAEHGYATARSWPTTTRAPRSAGARGGEVRVLMGGKVAELPLETLRARRGRRRDARELAAGGAGGAGGREPHLRAHRPRRRRALRRLRGHALAGLPRHGRRNGAAPTRRVARPPGRSSPTRAAGDHLLLRELGGGTTEDVQDAFPGAAAGALAAWGSPTPTIRARGTAGS